MNHLTQIIRILLATLKEIFDEAPYERFLHSRSLSASPESYSEFWRERESRLSRRARCC